MDKIQVGDKLQKNDAIITITEVYLFSPRQDNEFVPVVTYDWHNTKMDRKEPSITSFDLRWEGWEKV